VDHWLEHAAGPKLRPTTLARYRSLLQRHILPSIGKKRLTGLTPADVRLLLARVAATRTAGRKGQAEEDRPRISARTVQQVHAVLRAVVSQAVREEIVGRNVVKLVQVPTPEHQEVRPWTDAEVRSFLASSRAHRLHALFVMALALGLRRGELLGLRWVDVDFSNRRLRVTQTLQRVRGEGIIFGPPKSRRSRRVLTMPSILIETLKRHRAAQDTDRKAAGRDWHGSGLVFTTATGRHIEPRNLSIAFGRLLARSGVVAVSAAVRSPETDTGHKACGLYALLRIGAPPGTRTPNPRIKSPLLCQLS